jgi:hypothetical protein
MSKHDQVHKHPLAKLLDAAGLTTSPKERSSLHRRMASAAREAVLKSALEPKGQRAVLVGHALWATYQTRVGERPWPTLLEFYDLPPARFDRWTDLGKSVSLTLVAEVFG